MATTYGRVYQLNWAGTFVCIQLGSSPSNLSVLQLQFSAGDSALALESKRLLAKMMTTSLITGLPVAATHDDNDSTVTAVEFQPLEFSLVGPAIQGDFFGIAGSSIPANADIVFQAGSVQVTVTPDLRRPHWLLIGRLPAAVPTGRCVVHLKAGAWESTRVPVTVSDGPPMRRRVLYSGRPTTGAYTIAFAASPARMDGTTAVSDGILSDRPAFHGLVSHCLNNLLTLDEDLLRSGNVDRLLRFVAIFDTTRSADANTALVASRSPDLLDPRRAQQGPYVSGYWERADIVYGVSASPTFTRASAFAVIDEASPSGGNYVLDGTARVHGLWAATPGTIALSTNMDTTGLTAIHEFSHAASESATWVWDLYTDPGSGAVDINKKFRAAATDPVPANFGTFLGTTYAADSMRDSLGYDAAWMSFHPALRVTNRPNLMDNYWLAPGGHTLECRLDNLTYDWLSRRIRVKANRPE
jgi:hypothetical protein